MKGGYMQYEILHCRYQDYPHDFEKSIELFPGKYLSLSNLKVVNSNSCYKNSWIKVNLKFFKEQYNHFIFKHYKPDALTKYSDIFVKNFHKVSFFNIRYGSLYEENKLLLCPVILKESIPYYLMCKLHGIEFPKHRIKIFIDNKLRSTEKKYIRLIKEFNKLDFTGYRIEWRDNINELIYFNKNIQFRNLREKKIITDLIKQEAISMI